MSGRKGGFAPRKPGFPTKGPQPLQREYDQAPMHKRGKGKDKPKVTDLALGDRRSATMEEC